MSMIVCHVLSFMYSECQVIYQRVHTFIQSLFIWCLIVISLFLCASGNIANNVGNKSAPMCFLSSWNKCLQSLTNSPSRLHVSIATHFEVQCGYILDIQSIRYILYCIYLIYILDTQWRAVGYSMKSTGCRAHTQETEVINIDQWLMTLTNIHIIPEKLNHLIFS